MSLFDDELSEHELDCDADKLNICHEIEGPSGKKVTIWHDPQFWLADRLHSDEDIASESDLSDNEINEGDEQQRALHLLNTVVPGTSVTSQRKDADVFKDLSQQRYDPTSTNHQQFEIPKRSKTKEKGVQNDTKSISTKVKEKKFFELKDEAFVHTTQEPLSLFGETPASRVEEKAASEPVVKKSKTDESDKSVKTVTSSSSSSTRPKHSTFFIDSNDPKVKASLEFFCQHDKVKDIHKQWLERRDELIQLYRQRHKDAIRRIKSKSSAFDNRKSNKKHN